METTIVSRGRFGGRPPGGKNKRTQQLEAAAKKAQAFAEEMIGKGAFQGSAHDLLCMVYKSDEYPIELRVDAAKTAIGYEKPRLAAVMAKVETSKSYESLIMDAVEYRAKVDRLLIEQAVRETED